LHKTCNIAAGGLYAKLYKRCVEGGQLTQAGIVRGLKMTEYDVQLKIIRQWLSSCNFMIPNVYGGYGEMDVLRLTKAGYATEFEVKVSRADFNHDKAKIQKHQNYSDVFTNTPRVWWNDRPKDKKGIPNYFTYVVPNTFDLITLKVPDYAGLYTVDAEKGYLYCVKEAPRLHKEKQTDYWYRKIAYSLNTKYLYHYFFQLEHSRMTRR
jgi:hypothetical protein